NNDQRVCLSYTTLLDGLADQTICLGETVQLEASGGVSYQWQANETLSATDIPDPIATPTETTLYTVQITDDCGRTFTDDVLITIEEFAFDVSLEGTIDEDDEVVQCQEFTLSAVVNPPPSDSVAYTYEWSFTTGLGSTISSSTDSTVTIMASATQTGTETIQVMVTPVSDCGGSPRTEAFTFEVVLPDYRVPNVFTPNNDNQNDGFGIVTNGKLENYTCKIYNRWGALVFETNEAADLWDGTFNSQDSPVGVYVYHINFRIDEQEFVEVGDVTLLR
ncbi:MAG: gliding motility-associated C-terminal domain-containing protein, partial [Bacteroidota bacterium]